MKFLPLCLQRYVLGLAESEEDCVIACVALPILAVVESLCYTNSLPLPFSWLPMGGRSRLTDSNHRSWLCWAPHHREGSCGVWLRSCG